MPSARLLRSAAAIHALAPWKSLRDDETLRLDVPWLGVSGACISVIGALGKSFGFLVFPSAEHLERFRDSADRFQRTRKVDLGTTVLSLSFESARPVPERRDRDGSPAPLRAGDVDLLEAATSALAAFFARHAREIRDPDFVASESVDDGDDRRARLTFPYEAYGQFEPEPFEPRSARAAARSAKVGRNDLCPCGSGKKYKKCHLDRDEAPDREAASESRAAAASHELDGRVVLSIHRYLAERFPDECASAGAVFDDPAATLQLFVPWAAFDFRIEGRRVAEWFLDERGARLPKDERAWIDAQLGAWLSVWEVLDVEPGRSIRLRDLLTGEERRVHEVSASQTASARECVLGRIVDARGGSLLCGLHPQPLGPLDAARVVEAARKRLRLRKDVPIERLRRAKIDASLIADWERVAADALVRSLTPPELRNTAGDRILFTTDRFRVAPAKASAVRARLAAMEDAEVDDRAPADDVVFLDGDTVVGRALLVGGDLRVETNSRERADELRRRVEDACGPLVRHRARTHADPLSSAPAAPRAERKTAARPPNAGAIVRAFKEEHYATWPDVALPALGGRSPRDAVRTKAGREAVDLLLRDIDHHERRLPKEERHDFTALRRELGLPE